MGMFGKRAYGFKPPNEFFTIKKPKLNENRSKFNTNPSKIPNPKYFMATPLNRVLATRD